MLKKLLFAVAAFLVFNGAAFAQVEVNKSDQIALDSVRGIGPAMSKAIVDERKKGGDFKDWADLENRVKGIRDKKAVQLSDAGLTVNGKPRQKTGAEKGEKADKAAGKAAGKEGKHPG
ncbi:MAG TPA: helix-hairpin-helix domain-containing protein [Noviherbaspirillum sp.]|uniref:ComEA family DNA-binding protein n=1 Tax=Noviherbaspirillum sp. TaxID=1926288 RepID=UPI002D236A78|nr:helix-hairpin-helix domain-containing protein [Noviherbaspirillum sp.]HYD95964.1 helix-hairpin-helix domain-containing protein [Noviherbaspirillum sp.]